nr:hypothetical protein [Tanacetum cinerariifolium]
NRVLVVKHHNKTPYELFRDEGFFVGYSLNSKSFRVYNIRTRKVEENLHIKFLEDKPSIAGNGPKWLFDINVLTNSMNYVPVIAGKNSNDFVDSGIDAHEKSANNINDVNTVGPSINTASTDFDTGSLNINIVCLTVFAASPEATHADFLGDKLEGDMSNINTTYQVPSTLNTRIHKDHSLDLVISDVQSGVLTRKMTKTTHEQGFLSTIYQEKTHEDLNTCLFACFLSQIDYIRVAKHLTDLAWIKEMQEELLQFKLPKVWILVDFPKGNKAIGTKWVFRNKKDERGIMIKNKARLVAQAYAFFMGFMVYQMDVKSAFLYERIKEKVYVCQPLGFEDPDHPDKVYKVMKALYGLHQALRACYETLAKYLLGNGFHKGKRDQTLFIKRQNEDNLLVQVYVDDIIFGSTKKELCNEFKRLRKYRFQMSPMGELTFFLGLQVKQKEDGIFISHDKYVTKVFRKFNLSDVKTASTLVDTEKPSVKDADCDDIDVYLYRSMIRSLMYLTASRPDIMYAICVCARLKVTPKVSHLHAVKRIFRYLIGHPKFGLWYPRDSPFELVEYTNSDYAGASLNRKSTTRGYKAASISVNVKHRGAPTTVTSLDAGRGSGNIDKTPSMPHDSPLPRVNALRNLKQTKQVCGAAYTKLIMKVKRLKKTVKTRKARSQAKIVVSDDEEEFKDPSKQGRSMIEEINQDAKVTLVTPTQVSTQGEAHSHPEDQLGVLSVAEVLADAAKVHTYTKRRRAVNTGSDEISIASRLLSTTKESGADLLLYRCYCCRSTGYNMDNMIKDKGKGIMNKSEPVQTKTKRQQEQERLGLEAAVRLQEQFDEEERQRIARVHEAAQTFTKEEWENIRARVEVDEELTQRLQAEERDKYSEVDQAKMLVDLINQRKRYVAAKRAEQRRKKPMTQAQQRTYMSNYIKHMGSYTLTQLEKFSFDEIKELFEATMRSINDFVPMESEDDKVVPKLAEARSSKRNAEKELEHDGSKKQKTSKASRDDLVMLWSSVKERFNSTEPTDDKERELWVELKRLFEPDTNDELWKSQKYMFDITWRLYDTCGVHHVSTKKGMDI